MYLSAGPWLRYVYLCAGSMTTVCLPVCWIMTTFYLPVCWPHDYNISRCGAILWLQYVYLFAGPCLCLLVVLMSSIGASPILTVFLAFCWPMTMSTCVVILGLFYTCVLAHEDVCQCAGIKSTSPMTMCPWLCLLYTCVLAHDHSISTCVITSMSTCVLAYNFVYICAGPCLCYLCACLWSSLPVCWAMTMSTCGPPMTMSTFVLPHDYICLHVCWLMIISASLLA